MLEVYFTLKGEDKESVFIPVKAKDGVFYLSRSVNDGKPYDVKIKQDKNTHIFELAEENPFDEKDDIVESKLVELSEAWMDTTAQGIEDSDSDTIASTDTTIEYTPEQIFVENKPFSLQQIMDLIENGDIELNPNFQRHFIWDKTRQSRLIESIFLGLPLPSIYFSQYDDGRLAVVDGLQRLNTIRVFQKNELQLINLEYLKNCEGKKFKELKDVLSPLRLRRFGQTQLMCFVIDYRSPSKLKYDLFRRLNTGGKPLNNQEIRNCLSRPHLQEALREMTTSDEFRLATNYSLKDTRMADQEAALRFICFYRKYSQDNPCGDYNGLMDETLDACVDELNREKNLDEYQTIYKKSLMMAYQLFEHYAFRKVGLNYIDESRYPINKLLMMCVTVLLAKFHEQFKIGSTTTLTAKFAELLNKDDQLFNMLTWGTNGKANINYVFRTLKNELFDENLLQ